MDSFYGLKNVKMRGLGYPVFGIRFIPLNVQLLKWGFAWFALHEVYKRQKAGLKIIQPILSFSLRLCLSKFANVSSQF